MSKQPRVNIDAWVGPLTTQPPQPPGGGQLMAQLGTKIFAGDDSATTAYVLANQAALGDITGAYIQSIRDAGYTVNDDGTITPPTVTAVPSNPATLTHLGEVTQWLSVSANQSIVTVAGFAGRASASAGSGGVQCVISTDPAFGGTNTAYGNGATGFIAVEAGQSFYYKFTGGAETQEMRTSIS